MIIAVQLGIMRIFLVQNYTDRTLGRLLLGWTLAAICKGTDVTVTYHAVAHFIFVFSFPSTWVFLSWFYKMKLRNATGDKSLLGMFRKGSIKLLFINLPGSHLPSTSHFKCSRIDCL